MHAILSQTAEYGLRAMVWIAGQPPGEPLLARDVSAATGIPVEYLSKILRRLVLAGVLESRKGRGGGFMLSRPAEKISFRNVLEAVDAYPIEDRCAFGWGVCSRSRPCPLHSSWEAISSAFQKWAAESNLGDSGAQSSPRAAKRRTAPRARRKR
mgnify:FL=1